MSVRRQRTYGGKLADLVSPFLLIVIFNLDRKEVLHSAWTEKRSTTAEGSVSHKEFGA